MAHTVWLFGALRDIHGADTVSLPLCANVAELRRAFRVAFPHLPGLSSCRFAVDRQFVTAEADKLLTGAEEIALLPPVSGG